MAFSSWRGVIGMINPTMRPGVTEEVCRLLPEGIGLIPLFLDIRRGTEDEFETMMPHYEKLITVLAEQKCDLIHPHGAPPFMVQGYEGEAKIIAAWEEKFKTPIMSVAQNHIRALKALKARALLAQPTFPTGSTLFSRDFSRMRDSRCAA
jgi:maleate cis-trans isomerase